MKFKTFINETALQTGELHYITSRLNDKRQYFRAKQTPEQIINVLEHLFNDEISFEWRDTIDTSTDPEAIALGITGARYAGGYVHFEINPNFFKAIKTEASWSKFVHILSDYFHHELVHALQDQRMTPEQRSKEAKSYFKVLSSGKDYEYFKFPAELMAFSWTVVREFMRSGLNKASIINILKNPDSPDASRSPIFMEYKKHFYKSDRRTWTKFLRYCSEYTNELKDNVATK